MTDSKSIQNIVIVGGGTSGWMAAAYLDKALNRQGERPVSITLIEASDIPSVGVGEATIPIFRGFFDFLGFAETEWMEACQATYKLAIKFVGWVDNAPGDHYWHTFGNLQPSHGANISQYQKWLHAKGKGHAVPFAKSVHESVHVCEAKKAPKSAFEAVPGQQNLGYAMHLDAGLLADFLKKDCLEKGIRHLVGKVQRANLDERGFIKNLDTEEHGSLEGDLFIDCSGFGALLIEKAMKAEWESYGDSLLVDRAVAVGTSYDEGDIYNENHGGLNSYTTATAIGEGWVWHTPLRTRDGNGYVYSSRFADEMGAEQTFRHFLGERGKEADARHLKMRIGKFKQAWVKNCVSIGLSSGFIEPLESTGLALIQIGIQQLVQNFPDKDFDEILIGNFNEQITRQYENIRDFIVLHYCLTQREDTPFWKAVKYETKIPASLQAQLDKWKYLWPNSGSEGGPMFGNYNFVSILAGMNYFPKKYLPVLDIYANYENGEFFDKVNERGGKLVKALPAHAQYFKDLEKIKEFQLNEDW